MESFVEARSKQVKDPMGDLVYRDLYIRHKAQTVTGNLVRNDYFHTDGTNAPTLLAGEYVSYDATTGAGAFHIFAKPAGVVLDTSATTSAAVSVAPLKTTLRSDETEVAQHLSVLGNSNLQDTTVASLYNAGIMVVEGRASVAGITVREDAVLDSTLDVAGNVTLAETLAVQGHATLNTLEAGNSALQDTTVTSLYNTGIMVVDGQTSVAGLTVGGDASLAANLAVAGAASLASLAVSGPTIFGELNAGNSALQDTTVTSLYNTGIMVVDGQTSLAGLTVGQDASVGGILDVGGDATFAANLAVAGEATLANDLTVQGNLTVNGATTYISTQTLQVEDKNVELGANTTSLATLDGAGITLGAPALLTQRPLFEYTHNSGQDYWRSNVGFRAEGVTLFSTLDKTGTVRVARKDATGNFLEMDNEAIIFSSKWRIYYDAASDEMLMQQRLTINDPWQTRFTFTGGN
jgi:hypothetical protein